jgi:penicillin-binding protein 1A
VGGYYDFHRGKFDHAVQALRQPGSCFKPFVYSASLEKGYFPGTMVDDSQRVLDSTVTGARPWRPKNYGGRYDGFITAREGLVRSKNLVTVGLTQASGIDYVRDFALRFGFAPDLNPGSFPGAGRRQRDADAIDAGVRRLLQRRLSRAAAPDRPDRAAR